MARDRTYENNVIEFPRTDQVRLERAIQAFDRGDQSKELRDEFLLLASKGLKEANYFLGCMYEDGSNGASKDLRLALRHYENSIDGFGYTEGYLGAARILYHGEDGLGDAAKAFKYYNHVAGRSNHPVAHFMLGRIYQYGTGTHKDLSAARQCYRKAISLGSVYGLLNLAMLEAEEGRLLKSIYLRIRAGISAFLIASRDRRDIRLRGG